MIGKERALGLLNDAAGSCGGDQLELLMVARETGCTRYANSVVHQNTHEDIVSVYVRVLEDGCVGLAKITSMDSSRLAEGIRKAREAGRRSGAENTFKTLPGPASYAEVAAFSAETDAFDHRSRTKCLKEIFSRVKSKGIEMAGAFSTGTEEIGIVNTSGVAAYQMSSFFDVSFTALTEDRSGFSGSVGVDIGEVDVGNVAACAVEKALAGDKTVELPPGKYTVILEPKALTELLEWTSYIAFGAKSYQDETSFMRGKTGRQIVGDNITIYDDGLDPAGLPRAFDYEGVPKGKMDIIKEGRAAGVVYDTLYGSREGKSSTGHAVLPFSDDGPIPHNLFVEGGDLSRSEIVSSTERGLLVTRFHYVNGLLEPETAAMTGMTRDGFFLVEDGEVTDRVEDMRFTDSFLRILSNVSAISRERETVKSWWSDEGAYTVPFVRVEGMCFTGKTG